MSLIDWSDPDEMLGLLVDYVADEANGSRRDDARARFLAALSGELSDLAKQTPVTAQDVAEALREIRASQPRGVWAGARIRLVGGAGGFAGRASRSGHGGQRGGDGRQSDQTGGGQGRERVAAPPPSSAATASRR